MPYILSSSNYYHNTFGFYEPLYLSNMHRGLGISHRNRNRTNTICKSPFPSTSIHSQIEYKAYKLSIPFSITSVNAPFTSARLAADWPLIWADCASRIHNLRSPHCGAIKIISSLSGAIGHVGPVIDYLNASSVPESSA